VPYGAAGVRGRGIAIGFPVDHFLPLAASAYIQHSESQAAAGISDNENRYGQADKAGSAIL
jgi:hypothetical protein